MNIGYIAQTNSKGQLVIPQAVRKATGIGVNSTVNISVRGGGVYIHPVQDVVTPVDEEKAFLEVLKRTAGAWGKATKEEVQREKKKHALELAASRRRKKAW